MAKYLRLGTRLLQSSACPLYGSCRAGSCRGIKREIGWRRRASLMRKIRGVIHVGANLGQERDDYAHLNVVWIEPIPELFAQLMQNIAGYPRQAAYRALITDTNVADCVLHVASNEGGSSSVLDLAMHRDIWPDIGFVADIHMPSMTLDTFVEREAIDLSRFNLLVMDTQGSELLVLRGASKTLRQWTLLYLRWLTSRHTATVRGRGRSRSSYPRTDFEN